MNETLAALSERFIRSRDAVKDVLRWENHLIYPVCANIFCARGATPDAARLEAARTCLKEKTGVFSNFRGSVSAPAICLLSLAPDPAARMARVTEIYAVLKEYFMGAQYLALAALILSELQPEGSVGETAARARVLYERMKKEHPLLTSAEDTVFAMLCARSEKSDDALLEEMEICYRALKTRFSSGNSVQSATHVLALAPGAPQEKTAKMLALYDAIRAHGGKYGKYHELAVLAALSVLGVSPETAAEEIVGVSEWLRGQKGYGVLGIDARTRAMHAAMLVADCYAPAASEAGMAAQAAQQTAAVAMIAAQQAAMVAVISASAAASSASH